ncbi:Acetyltransferase (GNAT) family protein [Novipirellula galeiformis]|uniref:Acetyltransferase (GNAT) family protein n=1 Tax=Novipirellula galeiformis TaxID=2528004 RepID=A0A5C6CHA3_9BACT|nr:GNAT family N-acetyltransferase [Novipirellula galeiformis]TWU23127.1 Acetyltransferase (GNAT) family protein [Novipirellula galeiformis]
MKSIRCQLAELQDLPAILPDLLKDLSIGRAQIVVDQIRGLLDDGNQDCVLVVAAYDAQNATEKPLAAAVATHPPAKKGAISGTGKQTSTASSHDSATLLHAGWVTDVSEASRPLIISAIKKQLDETLSKRGVHFVQWSSDQSSLSEIGEAWFEGLGFDWVADLQYMTQSLAEAPPVTAEQRLTLTPIDWHSETSLRAFSDLVEQTYAETLDCPVLLNYRSTEQTIAGYQTTASFAPECWFTVSRTPLPNLPATAPQKNIAGTTETAATATAADEGIGVVILGRHRPPTASGAPPAPAESHEVVELVYMGLVPSARGEHLGQDLMSAVTKIAEGLHANRLILAVDQQNYFASELYEQFGLRAMLEESVWVKSL